MEFYENRPRQPFIGFVQLRRALKRWWLRKRACQALRRMSDEQLSTCFCLRADSLLTWRSDC
ncbi:DUF1127 domain-containing protein, partial [Salmonella enterica subsp. enterica serovar Typhimurium]|nr:DUF1127 domain-containing protein [Salmonella enterica subsp. enterica serovar Typhimurium]